MSYGLQDELSSKRLSLMTKIAGIDFEDQNEINAIIDRCFMKIEDGMPIPIYTDEITKSPVVRELYFRDKFSEIPDPEKLAKELVRQEQTREEVVTPDQIGTEQLPISQNCIGSVKKIAESRKARDVRQVSQEIRTAYQDMEMSIQGQQTGREEC